MLLLCSCGCSTNLEKSNKVLKRKMLVLEAHSYIYQGVVVGRVCNVWRGRAQEEVALLLSRWLLKCVAKWKKASSALMWVRVKIERQIWVFISAHRPGSKKSDEETEEFWDELNGCVGSFGSNESIDGIVG